MIKFRNNQLLDGILTHIFTNENSIIIGFGFASNIFVVQVYRTFIYKPGGFQTGDFFRCQSTTSTTELTSYFPHVIEIGFVLIKGHIF